MFVNKIPIVGSLLRHIYRYAKGSQAFPGSEAYWEQRYAAGGNSGEGSYSKLASFKADVINTFVAKHNVHSVIEFGCGDGNQLSLSKYPNYLGLDVSPTAIELCNEKFSSDKTKSFLLTSEYNNQSADLTLSLDVIYHLIEDSVFEGYMSALFSASKRYVIIYASDSNRNESSQGVHVKHRKFTDWVTNSFPSFNLAAHIPNKYPYTNGVEGGSFASFYIYEKSL